jgi:hypothetical protein
VPVPDFSDDEGEEQGGREVNESRNLTEHKNKLKDYLEMVITEDGMKVRDNPYGREQYVWGDEGLDYTVFKNRNTKDRQARKKKAEDDEDLLRVVELEDLEREREVEYERRKKEMGDLAQLQPHVILKKATVQSATFVWETEKCLLLNKATPLTKPTQAIFNVTFKICDLIFRLDYQAAMTAQFENLVNLVRLDLAPSKV